MRKELLHVMLELHNVRMKPSNVRKKVRKPLNVRKELSHVMLELHNWYNKFPTSEYCTPFFGGYGRITKIRKKDGIARFLDTHLQPFDDICTWL